MIAQSHALFIALVVCALPTVVLAQDEPEPASDVQYAETTEIDFEGLTVDAALEKPSISVVIAPRKASFNPLIQLRENFDDALADSANEIK